MTTLVPVLGSQILVKVGNGASPEVFAHANIINMERGITFSTEVAVDQLPDLADQSLPAQTHRRIIATDVVINGSGKLPAGDSLEWVEWWNTGAVKNLQITDGHFLVTGPFVLENFNPSGDRTALVECSVTLSQAGPVTVSEAP